MKAKLREWLTRYLPLEIAATACSLAGGLGASALGLNAGIVAFAATWAENAGFYGYALAREIRSRLSGAGVSVPAVATALLPAIRALLAEFGPAEVLDSFVMRPAALYVMTKLTPNLTLGLLLGKILADVSFYVVAVAAYEWHRRRP